MRRADRLLRVIQLLRRHRRPVTGQRLAEELEVSLRTLYRDIADLITDGVPIRGEAGVGYVLGEGYDLPPLMFDHKLIISEALLALRLHIAYYPIGYELLPKKFTLPEIHALYETILEKSLDGRNFAKRLMAIGIISKLNETRYIGPHRAPFLYKFNKKEYQKGLKTGIDLAF